LTYKKVIKKVIKEYIKNWKRMNVYVFHKSHQETNFSQYRLEQILEKEKIVINCQQPLFTVKI